MVDIAASDVTVTVEKELRVEKQRNNRCKVQFGDGALTYPTGGVPMPAFGQFAMRRNLDYLVVTDGGAGQGIHWKYDQTNNKLRGWQYDYDAVADGAAIELAGGVAAPAAQTLFVEAVGW